MRSSPKPSFGQGLSDSTYSTADGIELPLVARELRAFSLDDVGRRVLHEVVIRQHSFGARDLFLQPLDLGSRVPVAGSFYRLHDRVEDAPFLTLELRQHAAATEDHRGFLDRPERTRVGFVARSRPRRHDQASFT